ncbi:MAG: hypothetical protein IKR48_11435 [Kiritimatiellae bacterium]|nr:hypothetical protein [Kiritimatiellia bacterium]
MKCQKCNAEFDLRKLKKAKGQCPHCGDEIPVTEYCPAIPETRWWRLYSAAPVSIKVAAMICGVVFISCLLLTFANIAFFVFSNDPANYGEITILPLALFLTGYLLHGVVKGHIFLPTILFVIGEVLALIDFFHNLESTKNLFIAGIFILLLIPYVLPSSLNWSRIRRGEMLAYKIVRDNKKEVDSLPLTKYPLDAVSIFCYLLVIAWWVCVLGC